jgi:hypothetical protein
VDSTLVHFGELWPTYQKFRGSVELVHLRIVYRWCTATCHAHFLDFVASKVAVVRQTVKQLQDVITR